MTTRLDAVTSTGVHGGLEVALAAAPAELLLQQRGRLAARLGGLSAPGWQRPTRCPLWDVTDVVIHLGDATGWGLAAVAGVDSGAAGPGALHGFDPSRTPHEHVLAGRGQAPDQLLARLRRDTAAFADRLQAPGQPEVPSVRWVGGQRYTPGLAGLHILWDSWLHERDLEVALTAEGMPPQAPCPSELDAVAAYGIFFAAVVARLRFTPERELVLRIQLDDLGYELRVGSGVRMRRAAGAAPPAESSVLRGPAAETVDALAGRGELADVADGPDHVLALLGGLASRMRAPADHAPAG